ncbi:MAG: methyltransferase domain-containing protein [Acidobacteria bacterium]|nr:methyltransferase domain-containing protein [Acidobacteriota bacterium]
MDRDEVARRLEKIRAVVRDELAMREPAVFDDSVRGEVPFHLAAGIGIIVSGDPELTVTDELEAANQTADILAVEPSKVRVVGPVIDLLRLLGRPFVKIFVGGHLARQQQFNAHAVRHMNELGRRLEERIRRLEEAIGEWSANPGGIDARVRRSLDSYDAALRQRHMTLFSALEEEVLMAHKALEGLRKLEVRFVERAQAIDRRFSEKDAAFKATTDRFSRREKVLDEVEGQIGELMAMRSLLRKVLESASAPGDAEGGATKAAAAAPPLTEPTAWSELGEWMGDEDYRSFQNRFRGDPEVITQRLREHVARFENVGGMVADLGCGRGEFLDLLAAAGIDAIGVEINAADVEECRRRGHDAVVADLFDWLGAQENHSLGGVFMAQVIEHLVPTDWQRFVELAAAKLEAGGRLVVETINPESLYALTRAYVIDPTHIRPVHPELLSFLARRAGLHPVEVEFQSPVPDEERPSGLAFFQGSASGEITEELAALREALLRLDRMCCAPQEYTLQASRPVLGASD